MDGGGGECGELSRSTGLAHLPYHLRLPCTTEFTRPGLLWTEIDHEGFESTATHDYQAGRSTLFYIDCSHLIYFRQGLFETWFTNFNASHHAY